MGSIMVNGILGLMYILAGRVVPWSMAVTITLLLGRKRKLGWSLLIVGLMGIIEDVAGVRPLGLSSALLLCLLGLVWLAYRQYRGQWAWWIGMGIGGEILFRLATGRLISWQAIVGQVVALWVIAWLIKRVQQPEGIYVGK